MRPDRQMSILKWSAVAVSVIWIAAAGWVELGTIAMPDDFRSAGYKREARNCSGSFASRYECKSQIIISNDNSAFYDWTLRLAIVFVPPALIALLYNRVQQRRERQEEEERERRAVAQLRKLRAEQEEIRRRHEELRRREQEAADPGAPARPA